MFYAVSLTAISMRGKVHQTGSKNVRHTQVKQQRDYNQRHLVSNNIKTRQKVLLKKQKREERKWGKFSFKQHNSYIVHAISVKSLLTLINTAGKLRRTKYSISHLDPYLDLEEEKNSAGLPIQPKTVVLENKFI